MRRLFPHPRPNRRGFAPAGALISLLLFASSVSVSLGGELRPYQLPSQQRPVYQQQSQPRSAVPSQKMSESFDYQAYGARASMLSSDDLQRLKDGLRQKLSQAIEAKKYEEAAHYARLLDVVNSIR